MAYRRRLDFSQIDVASEEKSTLSPATRYFTRSQASGQAPCGGSHGPSNWPIPLDPDDAPDTDMTPTQPPAAGIRLDRLLHSHLFSNDDDDVLCRYIILHFSLTDPSRFFTFVGYK